MEWISVNDRLPESEQYVIGYSFSGDISVYWWNKIEFGDNSVIHWMLLPEPPNEV